MSSKYCNRDYIRVNRNFERGNGQRDPELKDLDPIQNGDWLLDRIFYRFEQGDLTNTEAWELANKVYDRDLVALPIGSVGDYGARNKNYNRITDQDIQQEEENLEFLFTEYLSDD